MALSSLMIYLKNIHCTYMDSSSLLVTGISHNYLSVRHPTRNLITKQTNLPKQHTNQHCGIQPHRPAREPSLTVRHSPEEQSGTRLTKHIYFPVYYLFYLTKQSGSVYRGYRERNVKIPTGKCHLLLRTRARSSGRLSFSSNGRTRGRFF